MPIQWDATGIVEPAPPPSSPWLLGTTTGALRNNFDGYVGCRLVVGGSNVTVTHLGHIWITGNSGTRTVVLYVAGGALVATASIDMSSGVNDEYNYTAITPVVLTASGHYNLSSLEVNGGNQWRDLAVAPSTSGVADVNAGGVSAADPANLALFGSVQLYVPVNFKHE